MLPATLCGLFPSRPYPVGCSATFLAPPVKVTQFPGGLVYLCGQCLNLPIPLCMATVSGPRLELAPVSAQILHLGSTVQGIFPSSVASHSRIQMKIQRRPAGRIRTCVKTDLEDRRLCPLGHDGMLILVVHTACSCCLKPRHPFSAFYTLSAVPAPAINAAPEKPYLHIHFRCLDLHVPVSGIEPDTTVLSGRHSASEFQRGG